ncbi:hypothetical protein K0M31_000606 [Melipona bicolor]|uniref:Uncharacterized protein n=1 Tax=Melipona bicolor TaxID=60889 RepID=A0AA40KX74_9HYME|nr:hypothetical protein K0M31_000606 [Melipona bicolor]
MYVDNIPNEIKKMSAVPLNLSVVSQTDPPKRMEKRGRKRKKEMNRDDFRDICRARRRKRGAVDAFLLRAETSWIQAKTKASPRKTRRVGTRRNRRDKQRAPLPTGIGVAPRRLMALSSETQFTVQSTRNDDSPRTRRILSLCELCPLTEKKNPSTNPPGPTSSTG